MNLAWVLASSKLAALVFTCIYPIVSAMKSRRIFVSRQHSTESDYSRRAFFSSFAKQCLLSVNLKLFLMQTEQQTQERQIFNTRRGRFDTEKSSGARTTTWNSYSTAQATKMETASTNSGAEGTSLNECRMLKYFTSKWKLFWIINLNISANIAVTKHALFADELIPYRPRLLGFHSSHVNAMKCIYVGAGGVRTTVAMHWIRHCAWRRKVDPGRWVIPSWAFTRQVATLAVFKMAAKFVNVLESEIDQFKKNAVPQKTKDATKFGVKLFKDRLIKFLFCK